MHSLNNMAATQSCIGGSVSIVAAQQLCQACELNKVPTACFTELLGSLCKCLSEVRCPWAGESGMPDSIRFEVCAEFSQCM